MFANDDLERVDVDAFGRMCRHFDRPHAEPLDGVEHRVISRRFDRDRIARFRHGLQAQVDGLGGTDSNNDLVGIDRDAVLRVTPRDLADQLGVAGRQVVHQVPARMPPRDGVRQLIDLTPRKQRWVGIRGTQRRGVLRADRAERGQDEAADIDCRRDRRWLRGRRTDRVCGRQFAHEVARLRPGFQHTLAFQQCIRMQDRLDADAVLSACLTHRRHAFTHGKHTAAHGFLDLGG